MSLKTKTTRKILEPIEVQVIKLRQLLANNSTKPLNDPFVKSVFCEHLHVLTDKLDSLSKDHSCVYQEMKAKITNTIQEFCLTVDVNKLIENTEHHIVDEALENMLNKFILVLKILEDNDCLLLKQNIQDCWEYIKEMGSTIEIEDFQKIKELGSLLLKILGPLQRYRKDLISQLLSERIALYSCQLYTTFSMLVDLAQEQHQLNAPIYTCKKYICERMGLCLQMILRVLNSPNPEPEEESFEKENHFVYRMDLVLDIISDIPNKTREEQLANCAELWLGIEDVFSHAMAIAQVCQPSNFKAITGVCQSIIAEYENLKLQLSSDVPDSALNNLFMNTLTDALYRLERKVNISILSLVMEVFSDPFNALRKLVMTCGNSLNAKKRSKSDLNSAIEDFDQLTDKATQIGMFAIACCKNVNWIVKIRNCLAGFESLETELVSAITAFYLHPDNKEMRATVKLLTAQWQQEMNKLHNTVNLIIDSGAYCQIILDDLQERVSVMSDCLDNRQMVTQSHVQGVVQRALSLSSQIRAMVNDIGSENIDHQTIMMIRELKAAILEADATSKSLLSENATEPQQLRVIKRCELLLNVVKRLQPVLAMIMNETVLTNTKYRNSGIGQGDALNESSLNFPSTVYGLPCDEKTITFIRTPYTVKNYKHALTIQPANSAPRKQSDLSCLIPYIKKGRMMRTEQSIMYKTPCANEGLDQSRNKNELKMKNLSAVRQHLFSRDSFSSCSEINLSRESIDLTNILEKLSTSSATLSTTSASTVTRNLHISSTTAKVDGCSTIGGGDAPSAIETPERIEDLQRLDKRIDALQKQISTESKD